MSKPSHSKNLLLIGDRSFDVSPAKEVYAATRRKQVCYIDNETGIHYWSFKSKGPGTRYGMYVDFDTVSPEKMESFKELSAFFEKRRKEEEAKERLNQYIRARVNAIAQVIGNDFTEEDVVNMGQEDRDAVEEIFQNEEREKEKRRVKFEAERERERMERAKKVAALPAPLRDMVDEHGNFVGFRISDLSDGWGGRGYSGYSESTNSRIAKSEGKFPATAFTKILRIKTIDPAVPVCESHHTSKFYNMSDFYDVRPFWYIEHGEWDNLAHYLDEILCVENSEEVSESVREFLDQYNFMVSKKRRIDSAVSAKIIEAVLKAFEKRM